MSATTHVQRPDNRPTVRGGIWGRQLDRYPANLPRTSYLAIVVVTTIVLYYALYVPGAVATRISADLDMSLRYLIMVSIIGNALGAIASIAAGLADRWGRANLVVYGVGLVGVLVFFGLANVHHKFLYLVLFSLVSLVEGVILVATPALVRDFSPQIGRASAMGFWTLGPVIGSLVVTEVSSHTLDAHPDWHYQFKICGIVVLVVFVIAFIGLRELAPQLRDQLMVRLRDRILIEARARGLSTEDALKGHWRQMLRLDIVGPALAISLFLLFYYIAVGLFVVFFATNFGYSEQRANALANWYWGPQAVFLILTGLLSDWLKVRKPFMLFGAIMSGTGVALFALATTDPTTSYRHFMWMILLIAVGGAIAFSSWMAAYTETVEHHNPAATATGLAVWGSTLRTVVVVALIGFIFAVPAASTLVDDGPHVQGLVAGADPTLTAAQNTVVKDVAADPTIVDKVKALSVQYKSQLATAALLSPQTSAALTANPDDPATQAAALSEITGKPIATVEKVVTLGTTYAKELAKQDYSAIPAADLAFLSANAAPVQSAGDDLKALGAVPADDLAYLSKYGTGLQDSAVVDELTYLQTEGPVVQKAADDSPGQWRNWWWVCFAGGIVFIPFIWVLRGRWSPAKARQDAEEHDRLVNAELESLEQANA